MPVDAKQAVKQATGFFDELYPNAHGVRLEEVDLSDKGPWWEVTLSFVTTETPSAFEAITGKSKRLFKVVKVDSDNGTPLGLRVWKQ